MALDQKLVAINAVSERSTGKLGLTHYETAMVSPKLSNKAKQIIVTAAAANGAAVTHAVPFQLLPPHDYITITIGPFRLISGLAPLSYMVSRTPSFITFLNFLISILMM